MDNPPYAVTHSLSLAKYDINYFLPARVVSRRASSFPSWLLRSDKLLALAGLRKYEREDD